MSNTSNSRTIEGIDSFVAKIINNQCPVYPSLLLLVKAVSNTPTIVWSHGDILSTLRFNQKSLKIKEPKIDLRKKYKSMPSIFQGFVNHVQLVNFL